MNILFEISPVKIEFDDKTIDLLPELVRIIPEINKGCSAKEISIERHIVEQDIKKKFETNGYEYRYGIVPVCKIKEQCVKEDLIELLKTVEKKFTEKIKLLNVDISQIVQIVEIPFTFIDLYPGDTQIHYRLFTKRDLEVTR